MTDTNLRVAFVDRALVYGAEIRFGLALTEAARHADISLVLDVYDLDNPVHPEGHVGWWKFSVDALGTSPEACFRPDRQHPEVTIGVAEASAAWVNPDAPRGRGFIVNAVLRANTTNAILHLDRVPALPGTDELAAFRATIDRDWSRPRFAPAPFVPGRDETMHIVSPSIFTRDAVGNLCLDLYRMLRQNRIPVRLHAAHTELFLNDIVEPENALADKVGNTDSLLYFYSTDDPYLPRLLEIPCRRRSAYYHGITDPAQLRVFDPELSVNCARAIAALPLLKAFDGLAANSRHSAGVLARALQFEAPDRITVIPPQLRQAEPHGGAGPRQNALLTVCQLRPHKKVDDVLRLFAACRERYPSMQCWIVGSAPSKAYRDYLHWVETRELDLPAGAVQWHGSIENAALDALYATAAAYISMSEDEGFCLPVLEAMRHGLPVLAYAVPAVAETLGGTGLRFTGKDFPHLANALGALFDDADRCSAVAAAEIERASGLQQQMTGAGFFELLAPDGPGGR